MHYRKQETLIIQANKDFNWKQRWCLKIECTTWWQDLVLNFHQILLMNNTQDIIFCFALFFFGGGGGGGRKVLTID